MPHELSAALEGEVSGIYQGSEGEVSEVYAAENLRILGLSSRIAKLRVSRLEAGGAAVGATRPTLAGQGSPAEVAACPGSLAHERFRSVRSSACERLDRAERP